MKRDAIIFDDEPNYLQGIARFKTLSLEKIGELITHNFMINAELQELGDAYAASAAHTLITFMRNHPGFKAHGYCCQANPRFALEGLTYYGPTIRTYIHNFRQQFTNADEFSIVEDGEDMRLYCWYDSYK
jgi:hypothetical protein